MSEATAILTATIATMLRDSGRFRVEQLELASNAPEHFAGRIVVTADDGTRLLVSVVEHVNGHGET